MSNNKRLRLERTSDENIIRNWFENISSEEESFGEDSDSDEDILFRSDHDTNSEEEATDSEIDEAPENANNFYIGKDGITKWCKIKPPVNVRTRAHNIITHLPGPRREARGNKSQIEILNLFIDDNITRIITHCTNIYIETIRDKFQRSRDARLTDVTEIRAFIGLLYQIGSFRCSRKNIHQLWDNSKGNGMESCYLTMSEKRFRFLVRCLRFDDVRDRAARKQFDKLAPIRDIFTLMVDNFQKYFCASEYLTIDEQLLAFRGKCPFRQYIPSKPAKYGIKTFALVDPKTVYTLNLETYLGTQPDGPYKISNASRDVVLRLVEPIVGTNRNITGDNWFTSIPLITSLKEKKLTYVGTIRKNKREIPKEFLPNKQRVETSTVFGFQKDCTLVSYCPKKNKTVLAISSMHHDDEIDEETGDKKKPDIITFYNRTKTGVDLVDQYCQNYNVARNTKRWPMVVFYNLLNVAAINALCIYKSNNMGNIKIKRIDFLQNLSWELIKPQIKLRSTIETLPIELRRRAKLLLGEKETTVTETEKPDGSRGRCYDCGRARDKTTRRWCCKCKKWMCGDHLKDICKNCVL
ncbi:piggyBac transposable element-derived protein 4-like [Aphis gossypii]|uniref:piggyBac transposable element-derived protein 4-like n=1 Tax=Aphis gossypii TaxID=80765 RepID=UPI0021599077|nr:piggyBac transposable element-derived protein 4-like [Aphis gossypii]